MKNRAFFKISLVLLGACLPFSLPAQENACVGDEVSVDEIYLTVAESCCSKSTDKSKRKCINKNSKKLKKLKAVLSTDVVNAAREQLNTLRSDQSALENKLNAVSPDEVEGLAVQIQEIQSKRASLQNEAESLLEELIDLEEKS